MFTPQLTGLEGRRVEVVDSHGQKRRFWVGRNSAKAQVRIHLELKLRTSTGGYPADASYQSVHVVGHDRLRGY